MPTPDIGFDRGKSVPIRIDSADSAEVSLGVEKNDPPIRVITGKPIEIELAPSSSAGVEFTIGSGVAPGEVYPGPYTVTPSVQAQTLATQNLTLTGNITVNPIPQNYGLITWNGAFLTVS